ncbi:hypothetical protein [Streptomyces sparsogenes]|uniref:hypothetical protein n=1 Tax=Streptomyces sparsogenes TaxID=67365 RepID=UPI0020127CEB|nr:hypothetical protein [Streptomyces sparsogenes]
MLTHAAADLPLPDDIGMDPAHYVVHVSRPDYPLLRLGPYNQCAAAESAAIRINGQTKKARVLGEAMAAPFDFGVVDAHHDPSHQDVDGFLTRVLSATPRHDVGMP